MNRFTVQDLIDCYRRGVFPMAETRYDDRVYLVDPEERGVLPLKAWKDCVRCPKFQACDEIAVLRVIRNVALKKHGPVPTLGKCPDQCPP